MVYDKYYNKENLMNNSKLMETCYGVIIAVYGLLMAYFLYKFIAFGEGSPSIFYLFTLPYVIFVYFFVPKIIKNISKSTKFIIYASSLVYLFTAIYLIFLAKW